MKFMHTVLRAGLFLVLVVLSVGAQVSVSPYLVLSDLTIIDGRGGPGRSRMSIVIRGERIVDIYPTGQKRVPQGATVMDLRGRYAIPGLIDSHYHTMPGHWPAAESSARRRFAFINGVTTVRDMAGDAIDLKALASEGNDPTAAIPRIYFSALMAGPKWFGDRRAAEISHGLAVGTAPWARQIDEDTDITKVIADAKGTGAVAIKLYERLSAHLVLKLTREAHRQGMKVWSHSAIFPAGPQDAVRAGVDSISHSDGLIYAALGPEKTIWEEYRKLDWRSASPGSPQVAALLRAMRKKGIVLDATLHIYDEMVEFESEKKLDEQNKWEFDRADWAYAVTRLAHRYGVAIVAGTDFPERPRRRGTANIHFEMELLVNKAGLTPSEAIRSATFDGARLLGIEHSYGSVSKGKIADLVVLDADPLADIRNTRKIIYVIKGGRVHHFEQVKMPE